jgi:O-antigen ligase
VTSALATVLFIVGIYGLFWLERDPATRLSKALWLPVIWLWIASSRPVGSWLQATGAKIDSTNVLEGSPADRALFSLLMILGLIVLFGRRKQVGRLLCANLPIVVFFLYCAISVFWSDYTFVAFKRWIRAIGDLTMVMIVVTESDCAAAVRRVLVRVGFLLLPVSILLIKYYPAYGRSYGRWTGQLMYTGVCGEKNMLGMLCMVSGIGFLWRFLAVYSERQSPRRTRSLIAYGINLAMAVGLLVKSSSMTSLACFLLAVFVLIAVRRPLIMCQPVFVHVLFAGLVLMFGTISFFSLDAAIIRMMGRQPDFTGRTQIWSVSLNLAVNPLVGTGFQSFWLGQRMQKIVAAFPEHGGVNQAHNGYLEIFLNLGWIGIFLLSVLLIDGYRKIVAAYRKNPHMGSLWLGYLVIALVENLTEAEFRLMCPVWIFLLLATVAASAETDTSRSLAMYVNSRTALETDSPLTRRMR